MILGYFKMGKVLGLILWDTSFFMSKIHVPVVFIPYIGIIARDAFWMFPKSQEQWLTKHDCPRLTWCKGDFRCFWKAVDGFVCVCVIFCLYKDGMPPFVKYMKWTNPQPRNPSNWHAQKFKFDQSDIHNWAGLMNMRPSAQISLIGTAS